MLIALLTLRIIDCLYRSHINKQSNESEEDDEDADSDYEDADVEEDEEDYGDGELGDYPDDDDE